ncbi:hypothetical protein [Kineococcus arenarius]|uniref:hypothetical protein n=1 Tax=Kineococcus sp. SYSU DK007 TaxID=3383128 RepID=UPI003D7EF30C
MASTSSANTARTPPAATRCNCTAHARAYQRTCEALAAAGFDETSVHWPRRDGRGFPARRVDDAPAAHPRPAVAMVRA